MHAYALKETRFTVYRYTGKQQSGGCRLGAAGCWLGAAGWKLQAGAAGWGLQAADWVLQAVRCKLGGLQTASCKSAILLLGD